MAWINIPATGGGGSGAVDSVNGQTGDVVLTKADIGLGNVNNTSDATKNSATATLTNKTISVGANLITGTASRAAIFDGSGKLGPSTVTTTTLGYLDVTSSVQTQLNGKQATITGAATTITSSDLTTGRALVSNGSGKVVVSGILDTELDTLSGIASNVQAQLDNKQGSVAGSSSRLVRKDGGGVVLSDDTIQSTDEGELTQFPNFNIADGFGKTSIQVSPTFTPTEDAPNTTVNALFVNPTVADSGFELGRSGNALNILSTNVVHQTAKDLGGIALLNQNFSLGNGIDPIAVKGVAYAYGFGTVNSNVTLDGPLQGYGFQPNVDSGADISSYVVGFYDSAQIGTTVNGYQSINLSPQLAEIANNNNATILNINPTVDAFVGNASANGISVAGTYENFGTGGANFLNINPTANDQTARYATGIYVSMDNVDVYPGVASSLIIQDLTIAADVPGTGGDAVTIAYTGGGTAGSEVVSNVGLAFSVQIEDGVSTAQNIADALNAYTAFTVNLNVTISGTASNPQNIQSATNLSGGADAGSKLAANFDGDVSISGSLQFGGALSIGQLNAFASQTLVAGSGNPASIHSLVSNPTIGASATVANADTLGINTAMLLTIGDNSTVTTAFTGIAALALPAVISMGSGSSVDQVSGGTFAVSLDASASGGTVANLDLCRTIAIPNGVTTVTRMSGYKMDLPFGNPATTAWGFYESPGVHNYFQGDLLIGGTAGSDDVVTNSSVAIEIKSTTKAAVLSRMSTTERNALTAINGMLIYNTTDNKFQGYANGAWTDLH